MPRVNHAKERIYLSFRPASFLFFCVPSHRRRYYPPQWGLLLLRPQPPTKLLKEAGQYESHYTSFKAHGIESGMVGNITREEWAKDLNVPRVSERITIRKAEETILAKVQDTPLLPVAQARLNDESLENKDLIARQWSDLGLWAVVGSVFQWAVALVVLVVDTLLFGGRVTTLLRESYLGNACIASEKQ